MPNKLRRFFENNDPKRNYVELGLRPIGAHSESPESQSGNSVLGIDLWHKTSEGKRIIDRQRYQNYIAQRAQQLADLARLKTGVYDNLLKTSNLSRGYQPNPQTLHELVEQHNPAGMLTPAQQKKKNKFIDEYARRQEKIQALIQGCPTMVYQLITGFPPRGNVQVQAGPLQVHFIISDLHDLASLYFNKQQDELTAKELKQAQLLDGFFASRTLKITPSIQKQCSEMLKCNHQCSHKEINRWFSKLMEIIEHHNNIIIGDHRKIEISVTSTVSRDNDPSIYVHETRHALDNLLQRQGIIIWDHVKHTPAHFGSNALSNIARKKDAEDSMPISTPITLTNPEPSNTQSQIYDKRARIIGHLRRVRFAIEKQVRNELLAYFIQHTMPGQEIYAVMTKTDQENGFYEYAYPIRALIEKLHDPEETKKYDPELVAIIEDLYAKILIKGYHDLLKRCICILSNLVKWGLTRSQITAFLEGIPMRKWEREIKRLGLEIDTQYIPRDVDTATAATDLKPVSSKNRLVTPGELENYLKIDN